MRIYTHGKNMPRGFHQFENKTFEAEDDSESFKTANGQAHALFKDQSFNAEWENNSNDEPQQATVTETKFRWLQMIVWILVCCVVLTLGVAIASLVLHFTTPKAMCNTTCGVVPEAQTTRANVSETTDFLTQPNDAVTTAEPAAQNAACSSSPCQNNATCTNVYPDEYVCSCRAGDFGRNCEDSQRDTIFQVNLSFERIRLRKYSIVKWDSVKFDPGNNYNRNSGGYVAPSDGYYHFMVNLRAQNEFSGFYFIFGRSETHVKCFRNDDWSQESCAVVLKLKKGDTVKVQIIVTDDRLEILGHELSFFTGYRLFQD